MTPPEHPTLDELADLQAGLLGASDGRRVSEHVSGCAECSRAVAAFDDLSDVLQAEAAEPPTMPAEVAASLDAALARAAQERASGVPSLAERSAQTVPARASTRTRSWARLVAAAAVVVVIGATGAAIVNSGSGNDSADSSADGGGSGDMAAAQAESGRGEGHQDDTPRKDTEDGGPTNTPLSPGRQALRPSTVRTFARQLSQATPDPLIADARCIRASADAALSTGVSAQVRWKGRPALVMLAPQAREARVLTCEDVPRELYSTAY